MLTELQAAAVSSSADSWVTAQVQRGASGDLVDVGVVGGSVTVDRGSRTRWQCQVELDPSTDPELVNPVSGARLHLFWNVDLGVTRVTARIGVYRVQRRYRQRPVGGLSVEGRSLEAAVAGAKYLRPKTFPSYARQTIPDAIREELAEAVPDAALTVLASRADRVPSLVHEKERLDAITGTDESLARAIGAEVYADHAGGFVLADLPTLSDEPTWTVAAGDGGVLVGEAEEVDREGVFNVVVAYADRVDASATGRLPWGVWWDSDPYSPTYAGNLSVLLNGYDTPEELAEALEGSGFGQEVRYLASPVITSNTQAAAAARSLGVSQLGQVRNVTSELLVNPWLRAGDVILVEQGTGLFEPHLVDRFTIRWASDGSRRMSAQTRAGAVRVE